MFTLFLRKFERNLILNFQIAFELLREFKIFKIWITMYHENGKKWKKPNLFFHNIQVFRKYKHCVQDYERFDKQYEHFVQNYEKNACLLCVPFMINQFINVWTSVFIL